MNLAEALNSALPDLPVRRGSESYPQVHPNLVAREDTDQGHPVVLTLIRGTNNLFRFYPEQYRLVQLFDGVRSYAEIAELYEQQTGTFISEDDVREFATGLDQEEFWYRSGHERNVLLMEKLAEERSKRTKRKRKLDVAHMQFSAWDPNDFMTRMLPKVEFLYSGWAIAVMLLLFVLTGFIYFDRWGEIWADTARYYTFTEKSARDLAEFWLLFLVLGFFHESAHGLTCKHYGGEVHSMGFHLIYLAPAFFVDVTSAWVHAGKWQRIMVVIAGIWIELVFCAFATFIWWGTPAGSPVHDFAYKIILITGLAVVLVNMNPLIKLDGYYVLTELIGHGELKESSTALVSSWVKKHIFRLPVQVEFVARRRRPFYVIYAILSGIYSYGLLYAVVRFTYNVFHNTSPEWAIVPSGAIAFFIFRSRLRTLGRFMKVVYLDKKDRVRAWLTPSRRWAVAAVTLVVLLAPVKRITVSGRFILEPATRAVVRAQVPGSVVSVLNDEGDRILAGQPLLRLENLDLISESGQVAMQSRVAQARAIQASLDYTDMGKARAAAEGLTQQEGMLNQKVSALEVRSPVSGTVLTPRLKDKLGSYIREGDVIVEVGDVSRMRARIYIPEYELRDVALGADVHLRAGNQFFGVDGIVSSISPAAEREASGLATVVQYKGLNPPPFYVIETAVANSRGDLRPGMIGDAKIFAARRSLLYFVTREIREFLGGKVW